MPAGFPANDTPSQRCVILFISQYIYRTNFFLKIRTITQIFAYPHRCEFAALESQ